MEGQTLSNKIKTVIFRFLCILAPLTLGGVGGGCTSDWNTHYDASTTDGGTLWQAISADGNLNNFSRVLQATGYDVLLDGSQTYTVFAPTDAALSASQADSLIAEYK